MQTPPVGADGERPWRRISGLLSRATNARLPRNGPATLHAQRPVETHGRKTVHEKSRSYRKRLRHAGIKLAPKGRPLPGIFAWMAGGSGGHEAPCFEVMQRSKNSLLSVFRSEYAWARRLKSAMERRQWRYQILSG